MGKLNLLDEASAIVKQREQQYGSPLPCYTPVAKMWAAILGCDVVPSQVQLCMIALKMGRLIENPGHKDSIIDVAGFAWCYDQCIQGEMKDENQLEIDFNKIRGTTEQSSTGAATGRVYPGTNIARPIQVEEAAHLHEHERKRDQCITCGDTDYCQCNDFDGCGYCGEEGHIEEECVKNPRTAAV